MSDLSFILWVQNFVSPTLTSFFTAITELGSVEFYMLAIPIIYWLIDKHFGFRFAVFFVVSAYVNSGMKYIFKTDRPPQEMRLVTQEGYSFPSGHAQGSTAFWGFIALKLKKRWVTSVAVIMIVLISFSRIYLAVHWPIDILGGLFIGTILLLLYNTFSQHDFNKISLGHWVLGSIIISGILFLIQPVGDGPMTVGFLLGALIGYKLEIIYVKFQEKAYLWQNLLKMVIGLGILFLLRIILKPLVSWMPSDLSIVARYSILGFWASFGAPLCFTKLKLFKGQPLIRSF